jgi:solute carrier family 24 (sodium/potassium/calcium exchanger), member 6
MLSIQYRQSYFCAPPAERPVIFVGLLLWILFLFSMLGISASDFFTPNLATLARLLHLDDNLAGVTFLALGNGSPDLFSTFSAMSAGSAPLAIGELIGAATFIIACVVGAMCIIRPFRVNKGPFLRDVGFFTIAVLSLFVILWDGRIMFWEAAMLVSLYLVYVLIVIVDTWWLHRREKKKEIEAIIRSEYDVHSSLHPYRDDREFSKKIPRLWFLAYIHTFSEARGTYASTSFTCLSHSCIDTTSLRHPDGLASLQHFLSFYLPQN